MQMQNLTENRILTMIRRKIYFLKTGCTKNALSAFKMIL